MIQLLVLLPRLLCAAKSPEFAAQHEWEAKIARPGEQITPTERDEAQAVVIADHFRAQQDRVAAARKAREGIVRQRFLDAGVAYPPREIFLRAFKHEMELELWAREKEEPFRKVATFSVTAASGEPGPKRREGDRQVPEGCYVIDAFNPTSRFHLSLGINYPNESDRIISDRERPGGEIYIHGGAVSIGCLPLGDPAIEELYLTALDTRQRGQQVIPVHIFPARMSGEAWQEFANRNPELKAFWENLQPIYDAFEKTRRAPSVRVESDGRYRLR